MRPATTRLSRGGAAAVAGVLCLAGLLFTTSAETADGTDLRQEDEGLRSLVLQEGRRVADLEARVAAARGEVDALAPPAEAGPDAPGTGAAGAGATAPDAAEPTQTAPVSGEGLVVVLADAPPDAVLPAGRGVNELVVHSQDIQAVVNALWEGGAQAMGVMDQRVVSTTAVRCVGSTLRVQGRYYPPPYRVQAVGDPEDLRAALDASREVGLYRAAAADLGLVYDVSTEDVDVPAYGGSLTMEHARVADA